MTDEVIFVMIMSALLGFLLGGATSRQRFGRIAYKQGIQDGKSRCLSHFDNWFDYEDHKKAKESGSVTFYPSLD